MILPIDGFNEPFPSQALQDAVRARHPERWERALACPAEYLGGWLVWECSLLRGPRDEAEQRTWLMRCLADESLITRCVGGETPERVEEGKEALFGWVRVEHYVRSVA